MSTAGSMIDEVLGLLEGFSLDEEQATTLAADMGAADTSFSVTTVRSGPLGISQGIVEIGLELMYCSEINGTTVTVEPWGRGYKNTTAATHTAGSRVVSQPTFPRQKILDTINQVARRAFPELFAVKSYESTTTFPVRTYDLPDDCQFVVDVRWQVPDASQSWRAVRDWRVDPGGGTQFGDGLNGVTVEVLDYMFTGRPIHFLYAAEATAMVNESDVFTTVTGLQESHRDVLTLGAAAALTVSQELSRLQVATVEQQNRSGVVAPSAALTSSRYLEMMFQQRLDEERKALRVLYPPRIRRAAR